MPAKGTNESARKQRSLLETEAVKLIRAAAVSSPSAAPMEDGCVAPPLWQRKSRCCCEGDPGLAFKFPAAGEILDATSGTSRSSHRILLFRTGFYLLPLVHLLLFVLAWCVRDHVAGCIITFRGESFVPRRFHFIPRGLSYRASSVNGINAS